MRYCVVQGASGSFLVAQSLCTRLVRATESEKKEEEEEEGKRQNVLSAYYTPAGISSLSEDSFAFFCT